MRHLKHALSKELGPMHRRPSHVLFTMWVTAAANTGSTTGSSGVLPLEYVRPEEPSEMDRLFVLLSTFSPAATYYAQHLVFPQVMQHQAAKITASGSGLGSDMVFGLRLGFSEKPSDLLPTDFGRCRYEPGSTARVVQVLSSSQHVGLTRLGSRTMRGLLRWAAQCQSHALIDVGALITGMANVEVVHALLEYGLDGMDGCVFIDEDDDQVVLLRGVARPVPLHLCGIPPHRRFTFYDQVHTTGTDFFQAPDTVAAVSVGKDMTLRDYAQGCWRMHAGAGQGPVCAHAAGE